MQLAEDPDSRRSHRQARSRFVTITRSLRGVRLLAHTQSASA